MKVKEIMKASVVTVKPSDTVRRALQIMKENKVNGTPVVDDNDSTHYLLGCKCRYEY